MREIILLAMVLTSCASHPRQSIEDPEFKSAVVHCARLLSLAWRDRNPGVDYSADIRAQVEHYIEECVKEVRASQ